MQIELHDRLLDIPRDVLVRVVYRSRTDMDDHELEQVIVLGFETLQLQKVPEQLLEDSSKRLTRLS
jgi:hypothetical protein